MNALTLAQPALFGPLEGGPTMDESALVDPRLFRPLGGEPTLDDEIVRVWEGLAAQREVACPVCQGEMVPDHAGGVGRRVGARCASCGSTLR